MSFPDRRFPATGVLQLIGLPTIVFLTVRLQSRGHSLASSSVQEHLHRIWNNQAQAWRVGDYLLMPDHLHLFCAPAEFPAPFSVEEWIKYWKSLASRALGWGPGAWQSLGWHHRIRSGEEYQIKWEYFLQNPVRAGLATNWEEWPYRGRICRIEWQG